MNLYDFILTLHLILHRSNCQNVSSPTYDLIGSNDNDLFVIPDVKLPYNYAQQYCNTHYHSLANVYDPKENKKILQIVNLNFISHAFIGYYKTESQWQWESNVSSNPMLWLQSPLAQITSNIEYPNTNCMLISRYGWQYTSCDTSYNFVCETREHAPEFISSGPYVMPKRTLKFDYARSLCRSQGYDLATIYEEEEYITAQSLCRDNTYNKTNCWIGYERGIVNDNEWEWIQDIPTSVIPINRLINTDLWSITPWQISTADIYCQATTNVTISYTANGEDYIGNVSDVFKINEAIHYKATDVFHESNLLFKVDTKAKALPGLKCTIHFEDDIYNTKARDYIHWNIESYGANSDQIVEAYTTADIVQSAPSTIDGNAQWIWNYLYKNKSYVTQFDSVTFKFLFEHVKNVQNRPSDNCASISYYPPYKWKTNNCGSEHRFICNVRDHKPAFKLSEDDSFALLTDRTLTRAQGQALCQNIYGYGLATIYSYYEFTQIDGMLHDYDISNAWIGLYHDNVTFMNSNNLDNNYGWNTNKEFIFDSWTLDIFAFPDPPYKGDCVQHIKNGTKWQNTDCNATSYALCNADAHSPNFTESQLGLFYLLDQAQNYLDGEEMCRDYVGIRSQGAIIYHPIENERAVWLCSNATNGKGCFIGYNDIEYRNESTFRWRNGALISVFEYPWFGNPWLNTSIYDKDSNNTEYCTAIMKDEDTEEWGWQLVDCDEELNMLCDSGDDHAQCWMIQNCAQCAVRSDCEWCGNQCQLTDEICYDDALPIEQEFGCPDFDPIINITYHQNINYTYTVNITMCSSTAPDDVSTNQLYEYVNESNCVIQQEVIEFYILSDWKAAMYGNYHILGKVIELRQSSRNSGSDQQNITTFEDAKVCDINIYHGYVRSVTCDIKGSGYDNNVTQFDMLHDVLRYLLPRLEARLFEGWEIPEQSLFGYSTMQRKYDDSSGHHSVHRKFSKQSMIDQRYANATSDLLWEHQHIVEAGNTEIKHMNFSMIHVFAHIPHHDDAQQIQLFTWCGYQLTLVNKQNIADTTTNAFKEDLYSLKDTDIFTKNYTIDEWRGIRPGNYMFNPADQQTNEGEAERRRRLGFLETVEKFCETYNNITGQKGETQFEVWGLNVWVSQIVDGMKGGSSFLEILEQASGYNSPLANNQPLVIIENFLELDLGFKVTFGFGWNYKQKQSKTLIEDEEDTFYDSKSDSTTQESQSTSSSDKTASSMSNCPGSFQLADKLLPGAISSEAMAIVTECCGEFVTAQKDCSKTLAQAHKEGNQCLLNKGFCNKISDITQPQSLLTGTAIYEFDDGSAPDVNSIIKFVLFFVDEGWDTIIDDIKEIMQSFAYETAVNTVCNKGSEGWTSTLLETVSKKLKHYDVETLLSFGRQLGKIMERSSYLRYKSEGCERSSGPILFDFDIWFHLGLYNPTLRSLCKMASGKPDASDVQVNPSDDPAEDRRRQMTALYLSYPIVPEITLPCIPIAPPWFMLCPQLSIATNFGLDIDPDISIDHVGAIITPKASFDLDASLSLRVGILILDIEVVLGVRISFIAISFPFEIGVNTADFGIFGDISIDIRVLEFTIYLKFKVCMGVWIFRFCPVDITLWQFSVIAYEYQRQLAEWGMGSHVDRSRLPANTDQATTVLRFYWAFKDSPNEYNHEYDYGWEEKYFAGFSYNEWAEHIFQVQSCQIKEYSITKEWYILSDSPHMINITEPYYCKYNMEGFDKLLVTEITIQWYSELGMKTCFDANTKPMFNEKYCCNFALTVYDEIHEVTGIKFDLSSYKMIVMDLEENWSNKCAQFYLNVEEQIDHAPYFDDCSEEGWRIGNGLAGEYRLGFHNIYGEHSLVHYNRKETCLNWYNSTVTTKTSRTYEILYPYDFLMIGLRFWAEVGPQHSSSDWYGIRIANETNYYLLSNVDSSCAPTEDAYSKWYPVALNIENLSDSTSYCYTDVLMYIDPLVDIAKKYKFDLEIIANVPDHEFWGFSSLVMNTFDNDDICVTNIFPVIELMTNYSDIKYDYYGLKNVPSLYFGYLLFDISFDYRFHDTSALISLSTDNSNDGNTAHWVINLDDEQSGIWIRSGTGSIPTEGILTLTDVLSSTIVDTDNNADIVYTKMYIQWNSNSVNNYMRVGFGHKLGQNIIASIDYDKFKFSTDTPIKYVGFARSLGSSIPSVRWKVYTNNLPSFCLSKTEDDKVHKTQNYKQTCIEDEKGTTNLVIYDLVTPDCIYYSSDLSNTLKYTFAITDPHDYVMLNMKLFANFEEVPVSNGVCVFDNELKVYFAVDGDHFEEWGSATKPDSVHFELSGVSHLSKLRFFVDHTSSASYAYLSCTLTINGLKYQTSDDANYWRIIKGDQNGKHIVDNVGDTAGCIWNSASVNSETSSIVFEFSFQNVYGADYIEIGIDGQPDNKTKVVPRWDPNLDRETCASKDYYDGISNHFVVNCYGSLNATFEHLSQQQTFSIHFTPYGVTQFGIGDIQLEYGICRDILPLIQTNIRYQKGYKYWNIDQLPSISENYIFFMIKCELDSYEPSESYISVGTNTETDPRFIVRIYDNNIEIWTAVDSNVLFGETLVAQMTNDSDIPIINNKGWAEFYIEWDKDVGFFRIGTGYILGLNVKLSINFYELYSTSGIIIDSIGIMHSNPNNIRDFNVITFQVVETNEPKLCWSSELESVAEKSWINSKMEDGWLTGNSERTVRIPTDLSTSSIFNGPFVSGDSLSKTLTCIYEHDYIQLNTKMYGFGLWDVVYPTWLNGLSVSFSDTEKESLVWFGTFLNDGGSSKINCDISEYKQWFSWSEPTTLNKLPLDILTTDACYYDVDLYIKHNSTHDPFLLSFIGDLQQTKCEAVPQFDIMLDASADTTIEDYPVMLNSSLNQNNYKYCHGLCNEMDTCRAWMYNVSGYCWLKTTSDLNIAREGGYISGLCDGEYVFDENSTCSSGETLVRSGYKADTSDYLAKFTLINAVDVSINCQSTGIFTISTSMDNGEHFKMHQITPNVTKADFVNLTIGNMSYASQIEFNVINNGYLPLYDTYYGFEHTDHAHQFMHHCGSNMYLDDLSKEEGSSNYIWKIIEPGLSGETDTVSLQRRFVDGDDVFTTYITVYDANTEQLPLILPIPMNGEELTEDVRVVCVGNDILSMLFAKNGVDFSDSIYNYDLNHSVYELNIDDVTTESKLQFLVSNNKDSGLRCSIYSSLSVISTSDDPDYWTIINTTEGNTTIEPVTTNWALSDQIEEDAEWIWNDDCWSTNASETCESVTISFEFSFANVPLYQYEMSTFRLTQCTEFEEEDAYVLEGVGVYTDNYFDLNDLVPSNSEHTDCEMVRKGIEYTTKDSGIVLDTIGNSSSCWYIRNANPVFGCKIDINNNTFTTSTDTSLWSSSNIAINDAHFNTNLNLSQYNGAWIWDQQCLPMEDTQCIDSDESTFTFILKNIPGLAEQPTFDVCQAKCEENYGCDGWVFKNPVDTELYPECILKTDLPIDLVADSDYVTGLNIEANQCDCICGDCYPGNEYHYIYIENSDQFVNPLYIGSTLYSYSCDFSLYSHESGNLELKNIETGNILHNITLSELSDLESSTEWIYPVRIILDGPILIIVDDELNPTQIYAEQCTIKMDSTLQLTEANTLGAFHIPSEFTVQFTLDVTDDVVSGMKIMTLGGDGTNNKDTYFTFGWNDHNIIYVEWSDGIYQVTDTSFNVIGKGKTHWTIKVSTSKLQIWASDAKEGYQSFTLQNNTNSSNVTSSLIISSTAHIIAPWYLGVDTMLNSNINISDICISDLPFKPFLTNQDEFDYAMRCWSGKYKNINRRSEFITSFISDSGCASVTASCSISFGEDVEYIPYFDVLTENEDYNEPSCFAGKFVDPSEPPINNKLCIMLKKCESPTQSLYTKSWGFSDVNLTASVCKDIVSNITRKVSVEWDNEFEANYGSLLVNSDSVYTLKNNYLIFRLRAIRYPAQGFGNKSVYISFMNLNDSLFGQEQSNLSWTFELNNAFGVKFYRGDRNVTERLIATKYVENILESSNTPITGYCFADNYVNITYANDGENYIELSTNNDLKSIISFTLHDISFVSKLRFLVTNYNDTNGYGAGLVCTIYVRGEQYSTSNNRAFWSIVHSSSGNTVIHERESITDWVSLQESPYISDDAKWIWNYNCSTENPSFCSGESVLFEFSFYNVDNPDNAPSFYFEWDPTFGDYIRFGFYNKSNGDISYNDNFNLIMEAGYTANFYSYDIYYDGYFGFHKKIFVDNVMFSIANDSYNVDWFLYIDIINTTEPKPCFGYDLLIDKQTRITKRDLETFASWTDDGRSNWELNGNELPGWHNIQYLNLTNNATYNKLTFPYYFHYPFVANQKSWQRAFHFDDNIDYDYIQIEFDVFTFCGWNHETDSISASLAFKEYLHFTKFWESTHTSKHCDGYNTERWEDALDIVRMNNDTHSDISCYAKGMSSPQYECNLNIITKHLDKKEYVPVIIQCESYATISNITVEYAQDGLSFDHGITNKTQPNHIGIQILDVSRDSKLRVRVNNNINYNNTGGLKCNIIVNDTVYFTNASDDYWSIISSSNNNKDIIIRNKSDTLILSEAVWIWNDDDDNSNSNESFVWFEFAFYNVFIQQYNLEYINTKQINITNNTNVTHITFEATPLTTCNLIIDADLNTIANITIVDDEAISSDTDSRLSALIHSPVIDFMYINLEEYSYKCRLDLYSECRFIGNHSRIDRLQSGIDIDNTSSWKLYAARGYECLAIFYNSVTNISYTIDAEDGNMVTETCNTESTFDSVNITATSAHYGCYTHVRFEAPNTNAQPFVLRIESEIDDSSTKFATYIKSWGFGNLSIKPLICSRFSNIVPLKSPIVLKHGDYPMTFTRQELSSLSYNYLFILIDFDHKYYHIEIYMLLGDSRYNEDSWNLSISETDCFLKNVKLGTIDYCFDNINYHDLVNNITSNGTSQEPLIWLSWDPFNMNMSLRNFSVGFGLILNENVIASLNIFGDDFVDLHSEINYVTMSGAKNDFMDVILIPIQFSMPKICLSQLDKANKYDIGNVWMDSCNGWELRKESYIIGNDVYYESKQQTQECQVTELNTNPVTKIATDCFHGPFKGSSWPINDGDYISRYFYVFTYIDFDIISVDLNYYSLCTWNPETFENDTAFVFVNDHSLWKSAPQYEFVKEYCEGFSLYSDWTLYLEYDRVLNAELIECLDLLNQICSYPVHLNFRHKFEKDELYFSIGIGAQLNQQIGNEAFGFSNVTISYTKCPVMEPLPIGDILYQPLPHLNSIFGSGDMLVISSNSIYYLVANDVDNNSSTGCVFTLFGGYAMWSQHSTNCSISGLPIMLNYPFDNYNTYDLGISDDGVLFLLHHTAEIRLWSRRTPCDIDTAYYYYSMPKAKSLGYYGNTMDSSIYSIDCKWSLMITTQRSLNVFKNVNQSDLNSDGIVGDIVRTMGNNVNTLSFNDNGSLIFTQFDQNEEELSPSGADFMIFDAGKLALIDYDSNEIIKQYDFEFAECQLNPEIGFIKYFYLMKPGDILWNGEALISSNCQYKLILRNGNLFILNDNNEEIWSATNYSLSNNATGNGAERFEFLKDGNMELYSYSSDNEILWQTNTATLLYQNSIFYADRAILYDDGQLFIIDNATLTPRFILFDNNKTQTNLIQNEYNYNLLCDSHKYNYVDKRNGFYASYISYYNCIDNEYIVNETTPCIIYTYCPVVERYENILLEPSGTQTNCQLYTEDYWRPFANDYVLFQVSVKNTEVSLEPWLYIVLTSSKSIQFGKEFDEKYLKYRTLLITVSPLTQTVTLKTRYYEEAFHVPSLFDSNSEVEWVWIDWNINFDEIGIGNSQHITTPIHTVKYSKFFKEKVNRDEHLFNYLNLAWDTLDNSCYGIIIVQFPPLNVKIPKGCHDDFNYTQIEESTTTIAPTPTTPTTPYNQTKVQDENDDDHHNIHSSNKDNNLSGTAIALVVAGCFVTLAAIIGLIVRSKQGVTDVIQDEYDVKPMKINYIRMEDQDSAL